MNAFKVFTALLFLAIGAPFIVLGGFAAIVAMWLQIGWYKAREDFEGLLITVTEESKARKK